MVALSVGRHLASWSAGAGRHEREPEVRLAGLRCGEDLEREHPAVEGEAFAVVGQDVDEALEVVVVAEQAAGDRVGAGVGDERRAVSVGVLGHGAHPTYSEVELNVRLSSH